MAYNFDPELLDMVAMFPNMPFTDPVAARAGIEAMSASMNAGVDVSTLAIENKTIAGPPGQPPVNIRIYQPQQKQAVTPALLYIHGGGFVVGSIDTEHAGAALLARELGIVVLSVDYRLAPEHPYPASLEDCYSALQWLHANAQALGVDDARIGVVGQSAGGGLSAATALLARDRGGPALCFQFLGIPELDDRLQTPSMRAFVDTPLWNRPNAELSWKFYLGAALTPGAGNVPIHAAPARAEAADLEGLPPTYISAMEFDPLRDEAIHYALKLLEAGVPVELHTFPGTFHGSSIAAHAAISQRQQSEMIVVLRRALRIG